MASSYLGRSKRPKVTNVKFHQSTEKLLSERLIIEAFRKNVANSFHFRTLLDMVNLLDIGYTTVGQQKDRHVLKHVQNLLKSFEYAINSGNEIALDSKADKDLVRFINYYQNFWKRKTQAFYELCVAELTLFKRERVG